MKFFDESTISWWTYNVKKTFKRLNPFHFADPDNNQNQKKSSKKRRKKSRSRSMLIRQRLTTGILVTIPIFLTYLVLKLLFDLLDGLVSPYIHKVIHFFFPEMGRIPGIGLLSMILVIYLAGVLASNVLGKRLLGWGEALITRLPLVKNIYHASKQLTSAIAMQDKSSFQRVVFIEYPKVDSYVVAFVTKDLVDKNGQEMVAVFLPSTPNPTTGFILIIPKDKVIPAGMTVEEGIKLVMSGGLVASRQMGVSFPLPDKSIGKAIMEARQELQHQEQELTEVKTSPTAPESDPKQD